MSFNEWLSKAETGDAEALYEVGECYWEGKDGVEEDREKAVHYYELAADQGQLDAIYSLGWAYSRGVGIERDTDKAEQLLTYAADQGLRKAAAVLGEYLYWGDYLPENRAKGYRYLKYAADQGDAHSKAMVANVYLNGLGGYEGWGPARDYEEGRKLMDEAAALGDAWAMFESGHNYKGGYNGYPKDMEKAVKLLRESAEKGHHYAQMTYALMCWNGEGVPQNPQEYAKWMREAAGRGNEEAIVRWAFTRFAGVIDGIRCQSEVELNECREIIEKAIADGDEFALAIKDDLMGPVYEEEARLGRRMTLEDFYGPMSSSGNSYSTQSNASGGCYIATAVYGSYDCPEVWTLRRFRDEKLADSWQGKLFIRLYYAVSPKLVKAFGNTPMFNRFFKRRLDDFVKKLNAEGYGDEPYSDRDIF